MGWGGHGLETFDAAWSALITKFPTLCPNKAAIETALCQVGLDLKMLG